MLLLNQLDLNSVIIKSMINKMKIVEDYTAYHIIKESTPLYKIGDIINTPFKQRRDYKHYPQYKQDAERLFESIRCNYFPKFPSRDTSIFVAQTKEDILNWALNLFKDDCIFTCYELILNGQVFWANVEWFDKCIEVFHNNPIFITHKYNVEQCATNYWSSINDDSFFEEGLFIGNAKVKSIIRYELKNRGIILYEE